MAYEYRVTVPRMLLPEYPEPEITISIAKAGGGTVGESYEGTWFCRAHLADGRGAVQVFSGSDLHTGTPKTHEQAARLVARYLAEMLDPPFADQADRLSLFAEGDDDE